jgi:hypothetical protein
MQRVEIRDAVDAEDHRLTVEHEALQRHDDWPILWLPTKWFQ